MPARIDTTAIDTLEDQVMDLLSTCQRLREENRSLKSSQQALVDERATLVARNEQARSRVESMIGRLKALESNS